MKIFILYLIMHIPGGQVIDFERDQAYPTMAECEKKGEQRVTDFEDKKIFSEKLSWICVEETIDVNIWNP